MSSDTIDAWMELDAAAARCRVSQKTIARWIATGEFESRQNSAGRTVVSRTSLESWLRCPAPMPLMRPFGG